MSIVLQVLNVHLLCLLAEKDYAFKVVSMEHFIINLEGVLDAADYLKDERDYLQSLVPHYSVLILQTWSLNELRERSSNLSIKC